MARQGKVSSILVIHILIKDPDDIHYKNVSVKQERCFILPLSMTTKQTNCIGLNMQEFSQLAFTLINTIQDSHLCNSISSINFKVTEHELV